MDRGVISKELAPSYFLECLLYNVPDALYGQSYQASFANIVIWLLRQKSLTSFICQNEQLPLFGNTPEQWSEAQAWTLVRALFDLWTQWWAMHAYATDARDRETVPILLAVLAIAAALLLNTLLNLINLEIAWWIDAPSVMGFYGIFYYLFNRFFWRRTFGAIALSEIPDLSGTWVGCIESSYAPGQLTPAVLYISQTWTMISVRLETKYSRSFSTMAALYTDSSPEAGLKYEYLNEPDTFSLATMQSHRGTAHLRIAPGNQTLKGSYYTGRGRSNIGTVTFQRIARSVIGWEAALEKVPPIALDKFPLSCE